LKKTGLYPEKNFGNLCMRATPMKVWKYPACHTPNIHRRD